MRTIFFLCTLLFSVNGWSHAVGDQSQLITTSDPQRPLAIRIFYPTSSSAAAQQQAANGVLQGFTAIADAPLAAGKFPLVILSHGSGGNNASLAWLATQLASQGMIVMAANNPGSTTGDSSPTTDITLQTQDIRNLLDSVLASAPWHNAIDSQKIGVIGHSKGGYSALALAGGMITRQRFAEYCRSMPDMPDCQFYQRGKLNLPQLDSSRLEASYRDPRIRFAIALDPGMGYVLTPQSLRQVHIPVMVITAGYYIRASGTLNLGGDKLPVLQHPIPQAGHFDFLPLCQPQARQILAEEGEAFICETPETTRREIHQQATSSIIDFLQQHAFLRAAPTQ
ncbi:alpha/beta hydrolase family protein [Erwinia sp. V71]|uniref:alpha/beta hydrolase family protein n=1 Tax=Erwinia sp. V71 TaxID=3369424 RepID=UPI003F62CEFF